MKNQVLKYRIDCDHCCFWCSSSDENEAASKILNNFISIISINKYIYFHGYRLPRDNAKIILNTSTVLDYFNEYKDPFNSYFYLKDVNILIENSDYACETALYCFDNEIDLSTFPTILQTQKSLNLIKESKISSCFYTVDHGADYWFQCNISLMTSVLQLIESISLCGYTVNNDTELTFPYS